MSREQLARVLTVSKHLSDAALSDALDVNEEFYHTSPSHSRLARTGTTNGTAGDGPLRVVKEAGVLLRPLLPLPILPGLWLLLLR